jgi:hypothetical protein
LNNVAFIRFPNTTLSSETVYGKVLYHGVEEFNREASQQLRNELTAAGVECSAVRLSFKPYGSVFTAASASGNYFMIASLEQESLPRAQLVIIAEARRGAVRDWNWFEPLFRRAVESEFSSGTIKWMTIDEYIESGPSE